MQDEKDEKIEAKVSGDFPGDFSHDHNTYRASIVSLDEVPVDRRPNVLGIVDKQYNNVTGVSLSHPLALMSMITGESAWCDHAVKVIGASCASTTPLFKLTQSENGRNKKKAAGSKIDKIYDKLMYPNLHQTGYELFLTTYENLATYGNAYWQIIKTKGGDIHSIYTLPPETMRVVPYFDSNDIMHTAYYQLNVVNNNLPKKNQDADGKMYLEDEIIHFKDTNERSFLYGKPRAYSLITMITSDIGSQQAIANWFSEGFSAGMIFKMDADEQVAGRNREYLRDMYTGSKNFGKILLLEGTTELVNDGNKFIGEIKFDGLAHVHRDSILQVMGVPLSQAGVRSSEGQANIEVINSEEKAFKRSTVDKYHKLVFSKLNAVLFRQILKEMDLGTIEISPGVLSKFSVDLEAKMVDSLSKLGISNNEAREILGADSLPSDKAGDTYLILTNNGASKVTDIIGVDYETGAECETLFEKGLADAKTSQDAAHKQGLGGGLKAIANGKQPSNGRAGRPTNA